MSALADFVNEQRNKAASSIRPSFSMSNIGTKVSSSFSGFFRTDVADDTECLTENPSQNGSLPSSRNRRTTGAGWFGFISGGENVCGLSRFQRIAIFCLCLMGAMFCFATAAFLLPVLVLQTRKFAALNTLGFAFLWGPFAYLQFLISPQRRIVTAAYILSVFATLYTSLWMQNTILTIVCAVLQAMALIWYILSYVPGGERGLKFITSTFTGLARSQSKVVLPI
ncbi:Protein C18E9.10 [Aphelenchoides avenae]|nr:Protein C18E9.10 [Aphelenchus avenae]